jgi:ubiquinone/menaquinone biosynthesis C-methylase UbiE
MAAELGREASWSDIAVWYDELVQGGSGPHELAVSTTLRLVPDLRDAQVLDLACGQGLATRALARAGASTVTGVDATPEMIAIARAVEDAEPLGLRYVLDDAQSLRTLTAEAFDVVTCQLGLMDIPDLGATAASVARVLRPGGSFVFVIGHPCFLAPHSTTVRTGDGSMARMVTKYLEERFWRSDNPKGVRRVGNHHRTLTTYLNTLTACGFTLDIVDEPPAHGRLAAEQPVYSTLPIFFAARAIRA